MAGVIAAGGAGAGSPPAESTASGEQTCRVRVASTHERVMTALLSRHRSRAQVKRLGVDPRVRAAARRHSMWMARTGNFSHERVLRWARGRNSGQNLAMGSSPRQVVRAMMRSRNHRANVLSPVYRSIGVGAVRDCGGTVVYTVNFIG